MNKRQLIEQLEGNRIIITEPDEYSIEDLQEMLDNVEEKALENYEPTEIEKLKEYKKAYNYLIEFWDGWSKEQQKQVNIDLNKIFRYNKKERVDDE